MVIKKTGCENRKWMELHQDRVQWRPLAPAVLNVRFMLQQFWFITRNVL
jgi:hypothetical protein